MLAVAVVIVWGISGPMFGFSDTWQLVINTGTTIVTFLMVFLVQNTQNRDAKATHLKLDELLRAVEGARTGLVSLETLSDEQLKHLQEQFERLQDPQTIERVKEDVAEDVKAEIAGELRGSAATEVSDRVRARSEPKITQDMPDAGAQEIATQARRR